MAQEAEKGSEEPAPVLAIDPGREKCGLAVVRRDGVVLERLVCPLDRLQEALRGLMEGHRPSLVLLGDRTGASQTATIVKQALAHARLTSVDEHLSTEQARRLYFRENPPRGWRRLIPRRLLVPPEPYDDYVAIILARGFLASEPTQREGEDET